MRSPATARSRSPSPARNRTSRSILRTDVRDAHADRLTGLDMGKGCLRYRNREAIDSDPIRSLLHTTATTRHKIC